MVSGGTTYRAGVIGTGFGAVHLALLRECPRVSVEWLAYRSDRRRAEALAAEHEVANVTDDAGALLRAPLDFVVVVSPVDTHFPLCAAALDAGRAVVCDKPLALDAAQGEALEALARAAGVPTMVFFQWRFNPAVRRLRRLWRGGAFGRPLQASAEFFHDFLADPAAPPTWRADPARAGLGAFGDMGVHLLDLLGWMSGEGLRMRDAAGTVAFPRRGGAPAAAEDVGHADLLLEESGAPAAVTVCRASPGRREIRLQVAGDRGGAELRIDPESARGDLRLFGAAADTDAPEDGAPENPYVHWLARLDGSPAEIPTFADGVRAQRAMDQVAVCLARGRAASPPQG